MQSAMFTEPPTQDAFSATLFTMMREQVAVKGREAVAAALGRHWGKYCAREQDQGKCECTVSKVTHGVRLALAQALNEARPQAAADASAEARPIRAPQAQEVVEAAASHPI